MLCNESDCCCGALGDFIEDDDGNGYAGSEEEDDWESGVQRALPAPAAVDLKKRKGSAGGSKGVRLLSARAAKEASDLRRCQL